MIVLLDPELQFHLAFPASEATYLPAAADWHPSVLHQEMVHMHPVMDVFITKQ